VVQNIFLSFLFFFFFNAFILLAAIPGVFFFDKVLSKKLEQLPFSSLAAMFRQHVFVASVLVFLFLWFQRRELDSHVGSLISL